MLGNLWINWPAELSEGLHSIFLSDLKGESWPIGEMLDNWEVLRDDALVHIVELLDDWSRQVEDLGSRDLETSSQDHVNNLSSLAVLDNMGLHQAERAVINHTSGWHLLAKEKVQLSSGALGGVATVDSVLGSISAKDSSQRVGSISLGNLGVSGADKLPPAGDGALADQLHTNADIAGHEALEIWEEWFLGVLSIKLSSSVVIEFRHFQLANLEALALNCIDNFSKVLILVRLDHGESRLSLSGLLVLSGNISISDDGKHSRKNGDLCSNKQIL